MSNDLSYHIIMTAMRDHGINQVIDSLNISDYNQKIILAIEGTEKFNISCLEYTKIHYWRASQIVGLDHLIYQSLLLIDNKPDIIIWCHNDLIFTPNWFAYLTHAWNKVYNDKHVGAIQIATSSNQQNNGTFFGLSKDEYVPHKNRLGRTSAISSFRYDIYSSYQHYLYNDKNYDGANFDTELYYHMLFRRQWNLWINTNPIIKHHSNRDTHQSSFQNILSANNIRSEHNFIKKYNIDSERYLDCDFMGSKYTNQIQIADASSANRFQDIDYIFDEVQHCVQTNKI